MRTSISALVALSLLLPLACTEPPKPEKAQDLEKIEPADGKGGSETLVELGPIPTGPVAKIGTVEIPNAAFREIYDLKVKKYADRGREIPPSADRRYRKSIVERLIYHEVLAQEAKALGVDYDPAELAERDEQQKRGIREWDKHLERRGETETSLREMVIAELREKTILEKLGKLTVSPAEITEDYDKIKGNWKSDKPRVKAAHILVPIGPKTDPAAVAPGEKPTEPTPEERKKQEDEALAKAKEIHAKVTAPGADFAKIAAEHSDGPSKAKGGDIGIFTPDRMAEEFSAAAFDLEPGQVSEPVKTKFGYHIIQVSGKWPAGELPQAALEDDIKERLRQRKLHQGRRELKDELLAKYTIVDNIAPTLGPEPKRGGRREGKAGEGPRKLGGAKNREGKGPPRTVIDPAAAKGAPTGVQGAPPTKPEN
jgi:parvulin-like peptidyl-prolyl isomerase